MWKNPSLELSENFLVRVKSNVMYLLPAINSIGIGWENRVLANKTNIAKKKNFKTVLIFL